MRTPSTRRPTSDQRHSKVPVSVCQDDFIAANLLIRHTSKLSGSMNSPSTSPESNLRLLSVPNNIVKQNVVRSIATENKVRPSLELVTATCCIGLHVIILDQSGDCLRYLPSITKRARPDCDSDRIVR